MADLIPLIDTARQSLIVALGGQTVRLAVWWQPGDGYWYASLEFPVGTKLVSGRRITYDGPIVGTRPSLFVGDIHCRQLSGEFSDPGRTAWRTRTHVLVYEE